MKKEKRTKQSQKKAERRVQVVGTYDPATVGRIDRLAEDAGKSRSFVMAELVDIGLPILEAEKRVEQ